MKKIECKSLNMLLKAAGFEIILLTQICSEYTYTKIYSRLHKGRAEPYFVRRVLAALEAHCVTWASRFAAERRKLEIDGGLDVQVDGGDNDGGGSGVC